VRACDVSVIGLYILDVLGRPVEAIPPGGSVAFIDEIRLTVAGTAGGTAVDCAKLGLRTRAVGAVGTDEKADFVIATLARHGIDTTHMQRLTGVPTSATILNVRPNGERPALHQRGASDHFAIAEADYPAVLDAPFVHVGGTGLLAKLDGEPTVALMRAAKAAGCTTTYDLIAAHGGTLALVRPVLPHVDWFIPSIEEARAICGLADVRDVARFFRDLGAGCVVLTMGGDGCLVAGEGFSLRLPAYDVVVSDTTGCGDAFSAGLIAALHRGWDVERAARFATAAGALVATGLGSDAGIVDFAGTARAMEMLPTRPVEEA
jgi:sugar/nucleoside kinase (ribokinase family)